MDNIRTVCVYAASSARVAQCYVDAARSLGRILAERRIRLLNGAGCTGLMGACSDACLAAGGQVTGVIPRFMVERGWCHAGLSELVVTPDIHVRKETMARRSDGVIALPGGCGTLEELLEIITWRQLGLYGGRVVILNVEGFYDPLIAMLERTVEQRFMRGEDTALWSVARTAEEAVGLLAGDVGAETEDGL